MEFWDKLEQKSMGHIEMKVKPINDTVQTAPTKKSSKRNDDKY